MENFDIYKDYENKNYPLVDSQICTNDSTFVYVVYSQLTKLTKIGVTNNPTVRLMQLQNSSGLELNYVFVMELEVNHDEKPEIIEKYIHKHFKPKRKLGEWFDLNKRDLLQIRKLLIRIEGCYFYDFFNYETNLKNPFLGKKSKVKHSSINYLFV